MMIIATLCWAVGFWYHLSNPVIASGVPRGGIWIYPSNPPPLEGVRFRSDLIVHLWFVSNCSTNIYLKHEVPPSGYETIEIASNVTFLDTRFIAKELGVRADAFRLEFIPASQPAKMVVRVTEEHPNTFYLLFVVLGIWFLVLGALSIVNSVWKKRRETQMEARVPLAPRKIEPNRKPRGNLHKRRRVAFAIAMIIVGFLCWAVAIHVYGTTLVEFGRPVDGTWIYPSDHPKVAFRADVIVHLMFSSNSSANIYLKRSAPLYPTDTLEIASNVTFLDTRFTAAEDFGVRSNYFTLSFIPTPDPNQPTEMNILVTYERIHPFYGVFIVLAILFSVLGVIAIAHSVLGIAYSAWKKRRGTQTEEQVLT